jgi:hypothetical protein
MVIQLTLLLTGKPMATEAMAKEAMIEKRIVVIVVVVVVVIWFEEEERGMSSKHIYTKS